MATATSSSPIIYVDGVDRQRGGDGVSGGAVSGRGCRNFVQVGTPTGDDSATTRAWQRRPEYSYRVRAADAAPNLSGYSSVESATTQAAPDTQAPTVPTGCRRQRPRAEHLTWTASTDNVGVTGYRVERCAGVGCSTSLRWERRRGRAGDTGSTATSYSYRVRAAEAVPNLSGYSTPQTRPRTPPPDTQAPTVPASVVGTAGITSQINCLAADGQRGGDWVSG